MSKKQPKNQVINNITINVEGGKADIKTKDAPPKKKRPGPDRDKLKNKIDEKQHLDEPTNPEDVVRKPADLDLSNLTHFSNNCIANHLVSSAWSQVPMLRFRRRTKDVFCQGKDGYTGRMYCDCLRLNDWCFRRLGLKLGMKLALFTDSEKAPQYLVIQNVVRSYEAPAHLHRLGTFTLTKGVGLTDFDHTHLCKPGTKTFIGVLGHTRYERYPVSFFECFPHLNDHQMRLYRMEDEPDTIIGFFREVEAVPKELGKKLMRIGVPLLESDDRPYDPATNRRSCGTLSALMKRGQS